MLPSASERFAASSRVLTIGIGGGGDAVSAVAIARQISSYASEAVVGGVAWERFVVDPFPGPRPMAHVLGGRDCGDHAMVVDPDRGATTPEGVHFCESRVAGHLGEETVLIDVTAGPEGAAAGLEAACADLDCDLVALVDVGGDAIADGSEPGLASPLCDAVMIAAGMRIEGVPAVLGVVGAGCDGELQPAEVLRRVAALAREGAWIDTWGITADGADAIEAAAEAAVTEASLLVARAVRGEAGPVPIRGGRREVDLSPVAALAFWFDLERGALALPLARAVLDASSIGDARDRLHAIGVSTELDYEENRA